MQKKGGVKFVSKDKNLFFQTLRSNVNQYFTENKISPYANGQMIMKSIVFLSGYLGCFAIILFVQPHFALTLGIWFLMGVIVAGIGMSVMHDANHGAYSPNSTVNTIMGHTLNMAGGAVFNWKLQHNILHHTYTNISGFDDDIDSKAGMRFTPHDELTKKHRWQFVYAFFLYGLITLYWVIAKDFVQYIKYRKNGVNADSRSAYIWQFFQLIVLKLVYFGIFIGLPIFVFQLPVWQVLVGFFTMHFVGGMILSVVFQLAHTVEETAHPIPENDTIDNSWAIHQMETTMNFSRQNRWLSWYVGGLNFQVEHHLFPKICHVHYPEIAHIVKATAEEFGVPYLESPTFSEAIKSHIRLLHTLGRMPSWNDVID